MTSFLILTFVHFSGPDTYFLWGRRATTCLLVTVFMLVASGSLPIVSGLHRSCRLLPCVLPLVSLQTVGSGKLLLTGSAQEGVVVVFLYMSDQGVPPGETCATDRTGKT